MGDNDETKRADFEHEVQVLSSLRCLNHPNIIRLITAYTKGDEYNFLLPVADGDLSALLLSSNSGTLFSTGDDILASLWGLSSAIEAVHTFFADEYNVRKIGCHYDIKPQNILCMGGKLVLSDFGLSRLRPEEEGSRSLFKIGEGSYIAPECEPSNEDFKRAPVGRSSDIWSLGCVLSEVLAYLSAEPGEGPGDVENFRKSRRIRLGPFISHHFHGVDGINQAVVTFLDKYTASPSTSTLKSLALLIRDILQFNPDMRPTASTITQRLFYLAQQNVFNKTCSTLEPCVVSTDFDLLIELWRLKIWGETLGLSPETHDIQHSSWLARSHPCQEYMRMQDILQQCLMGSQNIVAQLRQNRNPPYKLSYYLQSLLDILWDMQASDVRRSMASQLEESMLNSKDITSLPDIHQHIVLSSSNARHEDYRRVAYLATMKEIALTIYQHSSFDQDLSVDKSSLGPPTTKVHNHLLKTLNGERVLIEFMEYQDAWVSRVPELITRVSSISSVLNRRTIEERIFPVLKCKGYYHDVPYPQFGIVYQLPSLARSTDPMNLVQIISQTQSRTRQPSLTKKFNLAFSLVSHVLDFHLGGWLHKNICSFNIICFPEVFDNLAQSLCSPYFIGFNHCRLNNENAFTVPSGLELEYQHPTYLENTRRSLSDPENRAPRFQQEFDYYSVGLVLMEIAFWRPLNEITQKIRGEPEKLVADLLETHIPLVKTYMGDSYGDAVRFCLTCYESVDKNAEVAREEFRRNVVVQIKQHSV
jgi:serine/threonine protein kinase